jgi:hypothetical protein
MRQIKISITREHWFPEIWPRGDKASSPSEPTILILPADFAAWHVLEFLGKAGVEETDQAALLGVPVGRLHRYRRRISVPGRLEVLARIADLLRCEMALQGIYVDARETSYRWFTAYHRRFHPHPVAYMKRHGIRPVRRYLEQKLRGPMPIRWRT